MLTSCKRGVTMWEQGWLVVDTAFLPQPMQTSRYFLSCCIPVTGSLEDSQRQIHGREYGCQLNDLGKAEPFNSFSGFGF